MKIQVLRPQQIELLSLTDRDLSHMDKEQLLSTCRMLLKQLSHTNTYSTGQKPLTARKKGQGLGVKRGKTSKYHYVDCVKGKYRARVTISGVTHHLGNFVNEDDAGRKVDGFLDEIVDTKRPRNRDEFDKLKEMSYSQK